VPIYTFLCQGDIDWNDGVKRCLKVTAPAGTVVNASFPAPVSICTIGFRWLVRDESHPVSPAEKTFVAGITLLLLDVRHLGEAWHLPVAATAALGLLAIAASRAFRELAQQDPAWSLWR
jgi:hypothetical protein